MRYVVAENIKVMFKEVDKQEHTCRLRRQQGENYTSIQVQAAELARPGRCVRPGPITGLYR